MKRILLLCLLSTSISPMQPMKKIVSVIASRIQTKTGFKIVTAALFVHCANISVKEIKKQS